MVQYSLPVGMRYATLQEREQFYAKDFNLRKVARWFTHGLEGIKFAVIIGRHTKIFLEKYKDDASTIIIIDEYKNLADVRQQVLEFLPEAVYYDRNCYDQNGVKMGQELAFDLDPENITCPIHGTLADKMKRGQGLSFCELEFEMVKKEAVELQGFLSKRFSKVKAVYSGRGFHLHVFDKDAYTLSMLQRQELASQVKKEGFHIDEWVTAGEMRLIRLPFSLNGLVSRIVLPVTRAELERFDPFHDPRALPSFLDAATF